MVVLQQLANEHHGQGALPNDAQELANEAMVGIIFCNGFAGRYSEWSHLTLQHFEEQVNAGYDFVIHHGGRREQPMTKWLAPGTLDAMRCYAGLPRRPDVRTFFHPAGDGRGLREVRDRLLSSHRTATHRTYDAKVLPRQSPSTCSCCRSFLVRHCPYSRRRCCGHEVTGGVHLRITSDLTPTSAAVRV